MNNHREPKSDTRTVIPLYLIILQLPHSQIYVREPCESLNFCYLICVELLMKHLKISEGISPKFTGGIWR